LHLLDSIYIYIYICHRRILTFDFFTLTPSSKRDRQWVSDDV